MRKRQRPTMLTMDGCGHLRGIPPDLASGARARIVPGMTTQAWLRAGWLRAHDTRPDEVRHLWSVAAGDLRAAADTTREPALRFEHAYNAALKFCLIALFAENVRLGAVADVHHTIIRSLVLTLGPSHEVAADYLDACRERRDTLGTAHAVVLNDEDVRTLVEFARGLCAEVGTWLGRRRPDCAVEVGGP